MQGQRFWYCKKIRLIIHAKKNKLISLSQQTHSEHFNVAFKSAFSEKRFGFTSKNIFLRLTQIPYALRELIMDLIQLHLLRISVQCIKLES